MSQRPIRSLIAGKKIVMAPGDTTVAAAARLMKERTVGAVMVVATDGRLAGIFTERDALLKVAGRALDGLTVAEVMTPDPVVLRADDTVAIAIHKMAVGGFRHIPLVDERGEVTGIVTAQDVMRHILQLLG